MIVQNAILGIKRFLKPAGFRPQLRSFGWK